jgi:hypothetical protein
MTRTRKPVSRLGVAGIVLTMIAFSAAACGKDEAPRAPTSTSIPPTPTMVSAGSTDTPVTPAATRDPAAKLDSVLLTTTDLPDGFTAGTLSGGGLGPCGLEVDTSSVIDSAGIQFNRLEPRLRIEQVVRRFAPDTASAYIAEVRRLSEECRASFDSTPLKRLDPLDAPPMGDESLAFWLSADDVPVQIYLFFVRRGDYVWQTSQSALGYSGVHAEQSEIARAVALRADMKVADWVAGGP